MEEGKPKVPPIIQEILLENLLDHAFTPIFPDRPEADYMVSRGSGFGYNNGPWV